MFNLYLFSEKLNVDELFRNAWNEEIRSKQHEVTNLNVHKKQHQQEQEHDNEQNNDEMNERLRDSAMISSHQFVYIWTIILASFVTFISFFMLYR